MAWGKVKRLVVKIGSALVIDDSGARGAWLQALAEDVQALRAGGTEVILVSSGAVALARRQFGRADTLKLEEKQAFAAIGQIQLMRLWREAFGEQSVAQILLTAEDSENRRRYLNARSTLRTLLDLGAVPIVNENDTVATEEIRFGDNDRLAARVAQMVEADALVLLSDIDGLYSADPRLDPAARHRPEVARLTPDILAMAGGARSASSNGGMITKLQAAQIAVESGCRMAITLGAPLHPLRALQQGAKATWFLAGGTPASARKQWLSGTLHAAGALVVDAGAAKALAAGKSLLPAGVTRVEGSFGRGDAVRIIDEAGALLAKGLVAYDSADAQRILGRKLEEIAAIVGFQGRNVLVHADDMVRMASLDDAVRIAPAAPLA